MRVIDADDFFERMKNDTDLCSEMEKDGLKALKKYLDLQPTAYDPDKVVKELEKLQTYNMGLATLMSDLQRNGVYRHYICREEAIEIVKGNYRMEALEKLEQLKEGVKE